MAGKNSTTHQQHTNTCQVGSNEDQSMLGVSLFSGGGIGDLALRACGVRVLVASELLQDRASVFRKNYPDTLMVEGDIRATKSQIIAEVERALDGRELDVLFATPPCQGMSKNGRGKLLSGIRAGLKPEFDERNRLAMDAIEIAIALRPRLVVFENVPEMQYAVIEHNGQVCDLLDFMTARMENDYHAKWEVVEFADYGVPQRRQRLITSFVRKDAASNKAGSWRVLPPPTHSERPDAFTKAWRTVDAALANVPPLDARTKSSARSESIAFHCVPLLDEEKYHWVKNTPPGKGAFDNQCINPECKFDGNPTHGSRHNTEGINRSNRDTPINCVKCGALLPRPWVKEDGRYRLMSGFTSAYKRMRGDLPASALTRNLSYACSDQKLHPRENRVLSLHEAFILHTVSEYQFSWKRDDGKKISDKTIREIIGESIPPLGLEIIFRHLFRIVAKQEQSVAA